MPTLASPSTAQLFTIPAASWRAINVRVGSVLRVQSLATEMAVSFPGYLDVVAASKLWSASTFNGLVAQAQALAAYTSVAIADFVVLHGAVTPAIASGVVSAALQEQTVAALQKLAADTALLVAAFNVLTPQVVTFSAVNARLDSQMTADLQGLGSFWAPIATMLTSLDAATAQMTGAWNAISNDLANTVTAPVGVTLPYLETLQIDAALICWENIQTEATAFVSAVAGQQQYWTNPSANLP